MKKNYIYIVLVIILLTLSFFVKSDNKVFKVDGIKYAVSVNGTEQASFPTKGSYTVTTSCTNADSKWNYQKWVAEVYNITGSVTCNISFTPTTKVTFASKITSLLGTNTTVASESTTGNGSTLEIVQSPLPTSGTSMDYRYRGVNPANYIMFNDELWRIIGVFDSNSHNVKNANDESVNLVKIIRNDSIGKYVWDNDTSGSSNGSNNYVNSDIYNLLNKAYYNTTSADAEPIDATGQDYCYTYQTSITGKCDFTKIGIQQEYKSMVEESVTWYLGGYTSESIKSSAFYTYERTSTQVYSGNTSLVIAPIGLMYASDYGYAAPLACNDTNVGSFNSRNYILGAACAARDWLRSNYREMTITHYTTRSQGIFHVSDMGNLKSGNSNGGFDTRPVLYLDSSVYYLSGTGTQSDPYIIAMD